MKKSARIALLSVVLLASFIGGLLADSHMQRVKAAVGHKYTLVFVNQDYGVTGCTFDDVSMKSVNDYAAAGWDAVSMTSGSGGVCGQYTVLMRK